MRDRTPPEEWRPVAGWPYEVSNLGRVRRSGGKIRRLNRMPRGYLRVALHDAPRARSFMVHILVAEAFIGPAPGPVGCRRGCFQMNHINGAQADNRPENLEWVTPAENHRHATRMGLKCRGVHHPRAKLNPSRVREIRRRVQAGDRHIDIAQDLGVSQANVGYVARGRTWKHVEEAA